MNYLNLHEINIMMSMDPIIGFIHTKMTKIFINLMEK